MPKFVWVDPPPIPPSPEPLHPHPVIDALLRQRVGDPSLAAEFLDLSERPIPDPFALPGMAAAADRTLKAIANEERIGLYGDYDADGVCSLAIIHHALRAASSGVAPLESIVPTRIDGYGLNPRAIERFAEAGVTLLIAADCASGDHEHVALARSRGMDVVIIDHHEMHDSGPEGAFVVSARAHRGAPYQDLVSTALCLLFATALARRGADVGDGPGQDPRSLLDLAMIATIADMAPLTGINRQLVCDGLRLLRRTPRPGLATLIASMDRQPGVADARFISMHLGPLLNAPGRRSDPRAAFEILVVEDGDEAQEYVPLLHDARDWVRKSRADVGDREFAILQSDPGLGERRTIVVTLDDCPPGIAGLIAGDLVGKLQRPVIALAKDGMIYRGSARSWGDFSIIGALTELAPLMLRYGGHKGAAGLAIDPERIPEFELALEEIAAREGVISQPDPTIVIDVDLPHQHFDVATVESLLALRPYGVGNREPVLCLRDVAVSRVQTMGTAANHLKIHVKVNDGTHDVILWGSADRLHEAAALRRIDVVGRLEKNEWNNTVRPQFIAEDFRPAGQGSGLLAD